MNLRPMKTPVVEWFGCYADSWHGWIVDEAFTHPAKFARGLIRRILLHGIDRGYWQPGERIGDPFGGVACGGVVASSLGFPWIGIELEAKFVGIGTDNIEFHRNWYEVGKPRPFLAQGDSREFHKIVEGLFLDGSVTSPHYADSIHDGKETAQIVILRSGSLDAAISSPPYADIAAGQGGLNHLPAKEEGQQSGREHAGSQASDQRYGSGEGQISRLSQGTVDHVVTSPPWESNCEGAIGAKKWKDPEKAAAAMSAAGKGNYASPEARKAQFERDNSKTYGESDGQIGKDSGETYWAAMRKVYASLFIALKPGGYAAIVVKDYVKNKSRVPLCDDTMRLLEHCGFEPVERIHAMLVEDKEHHDMFSGTVVVRKQRKSFFRRLAEKKGSPPIDFEEVLIVRKPL